ncbi:hypothetical protein AB0I66_25100 [Streptomyces sp. NPDC050439]|uniref:hypothetical protein n=1 Tax=unclassified Streptomyces TaxID=2593676 RepID=UPI0034319ABD
MSRAASPRPAWLRAALILLALLGTVLAPATPSEAVSAPPAVVSGEPAGEAHQDTVDSSVRVSGRRAVAVSVPAARRRTPRRSLPLPARCRRHVPAPRSVVLRC